MDKFALHLWMILDVVGVKYSDRKVLYVLRIFFLKKLFFLIFGWYLRNFEPWFQLGFRPWSFLRVMTFLPFVLFIFIVFFFFRLQELDCVVSSLHSNYVDASFGIQFPDDTFADDLY